MSSCLFLSHLCHALLVGAGARWCRSSDDELGGAGAQMTELDWLGGAGAQMMSSAADGSAVEQMARWYPS